MASDPKNIASTKFISSQLIQSFDSNLTTINISVSLQWRLTNSLKNSRTGDFYQILKLKNALKSDRDISGDASIAKNVAQAIV